MPAVLRGGARLRLQPIPRGLEDQERSHGILEVDLRRFDGIHSGGTAAAGGGVRHRPDHDWDRLPVSLEHDGRPRAQNAGLSAWDKRAILGETAAKLLKLT